MRKPSKILFHSLVIAWKDLIEFTRSRIGLVFSMLFPIMIIAMFGYMFPSSANMLHDVQIGFVLEDTGQQGYGKNVTSALLSAYSNSTMFNLVNISSVDDAEARIMSGEIKGAIVVPENFSDCLENQTPATITIITDPSSPALSSAINQAFSSIIRGISDGLAKEIISMMPGAKPEFLLQPISASTETVVPGGGNYFDFIAPGFIAMTVMMSGLTAVGAAIARERETGTLDGFLMCPISRASIILGKTISRTIRNLIQSFMIIGLAVLLFDVHIRGDPLLILLILILGTLSFLGFGILATAVAKEQESAQLILGLLQFPMLFLCGVLFPVEQMPVPLQIVSKFLPLTYAVNALRKVMILGVGVEGIAFELIILIILCGVTVFAGVPLFDRAVRR